MAWCRYRVGFVNQGGVFEGHASTGLNRLLHIVRVVEAGWQQPVGADALSRTAAPHATQFNCSVAAVAALGLAGADSGPAVPVSQSWLSNGNMESSAGWNNMSSGFVYDTSHARTGLRSVRVNEGDGGAVQVGECGACNGVTKVPVSRCHTAQCWGRCSRACTPQPLFFSPPISAGNITLRAWSKAFKAGGSATTAGTSSDYSLYADITYTEGASQWGERAEFSLGSHDWEFQEHTFVPVDLTATRKV